MSRIDLFFTYVLLIISSMLIQWAKPIFKQKAETLKAESQGFIWRKIAPNQNCIGIIVQVLESDPEYIICLMFNYSEQWKKQKKSLLLEFSRESTYDLFPLKDSVICEILMPFKELSPKIWKLQKRRDALVLENEQIKWMIKMNCRSENCESMRRKVLLELRQINLIIRAFKRLVTLTNTVLHFYEVETWHDNSYEQWKEQLSLLREETQNMQNLLLIANVA